MVVYCWLSFHNWIFFRVPNSIDQAAKVFFFHFIGQLFIFSFWWRVYIRSCFSCLGQAHELFKCPRRTQWRIYLRLGLCISKVWCLMRCLPSRMSFFLRVELIYHFSKKTIVLWEITVWSFVKLTLPACVMIPIHLAALDVLDTFSVGKLGMVLGFRRTIAKRRNIWYIANVAGK